MKFKVYVETSKNAIIAGNQKATRLWWENERSLFNLYSSNIVLREAAMGDYAEAQKRIKLIENLPFLEINSQTEEMAINLVKLGGVPANSIEDAFHISVATVHKMDFLLTWNFKHIANVVAKVKIEKIAEKLRYKLPILCSPQELMESQNV